jgi:ComF family protein
MKPPVMPADAAAAPFAGSWWRLPAPCGVCGSWTRPAGACGHCLRRFAPPVHRCQRCAIPVPADVRECGQCIGTPPRFERAIAAFNYAFPWDRVIASFKFRQGLEWASPLARQLALATSADAGEVELVTAVPLAASRLRERGYNQAWELARRTARMHGLPVQHDLLLRLRDTPQQMTLAKQQRDANLRGAFMPGGAVARRALQGRCVALVDDVLTTGTTANEAASALIEAGARSVHIWVLARTRRDGA